MKFQLFIAATILASALFASNASAADPATINNGTKALLEGKFDDALSQYDGLEVTPEQAATLSYNRAIANYRKGDIAAARALFSETAETDSNALAAKSRFNLGNCDYAQALQQKEQDRPAAINSLRSAIENYRTSLRHNRDDADARSNIELANRLIKSLEEQEKQEQQQQNEEQQQDDQTSEKDQSEQGDESKNEEQSESDSDSKQDSDSSESGESSDDTDASKPDDQKQQDDQSQDQSKQSENNSSEDKADEQEGGDQEGDSASKEEPSDGSKSNESESESKSEDGEPQDGDSKQSSEQEQPSESDGKQEEQQNESSEHESGQSEQDDSEQDANDQQQGAGDAKDQKAQDASPEPTGSAGQTGEEMDAGKDNGKAVPGYGTSRSGEPTGNIDKQEAMKMLQAIRDRDLMRRIQKLQQTRRRHVPVARDW